MCKGYSQYRDNEYEFVRNIVYGAARYNAANSAFSKEQAMAVSRQKFPWEKGFKENKPMSSKQVQKLLSFISKPEKRN